MNTSHSKEEALAEVKELLASGALSPEDLKSFIPDHSVESHIDTKSVPEGRSKVLGAALYVVGAIIVCSGLAVLIGQNWSQLDTLTRILFTFGLGVLFLGVGAYFKRVKKIDDMLSETILAIGSVALIIGSGVVTHEAGLPLEESSTLATLAILLVAVHGFLYMLLRSPMVAFAGIAMGVVFVQSLADAVARDRFTSDLAQYVLMFNGLWLIALGLLLQRRAVLHTIAHAVQVIGAFLLLGVAMILMMSSGDSLKLVDALWPIIYFLLLGLVVYASILVRSKGLLFTASAFLILYILYISSQYFSETFGWPFSLMLSGVAIIAIAFGVRKLSSRYFSRLSR